MLLPISTAPGGVGAALPEAAPLVTSSREPPTAVTALDLWREVLAAHLAARPNAVTPAGDAYPETTHGDVRRAALVFSRELCQPRYDLANLTATREAWREALARIHTGAAGLPWDSLYPSNPQFWLGDARALAQRLAAVDARRNRLVFSPPYDLAHAVAVGDPMTTYLDLRAHFMARRLVRTGEGGWRFPDTTVGDAIQVARIVDAEIASVMRATREPLVMEFVTDRLPLWREVAAQIAATARTVPADAPYPHNERVWRAYRRVSIPLAVAHEAATSAKSTPLTQPVLR